jgi:NAD(P)H-dependent flavin oxidoreductase YrpB (nitropropane dioxygenase family)
VPTAGKSDESENTELHDNCKKFMQMFDLAVPIVQAPMDGPVTAALAITVANCGALGSLPLTWLSPNLAFERVTEVKSKTQYWNRGQSLNSE